MQVKEVLIIEDDYHVAEELKKSLQQSEYFFCAAVLHSLEEGFNFLNKKLPDIILVDLGLPDGSGIDLIRYVEALNAKCSFQTSCLVITMYGDEGHVMQAIEAGAAGYLLKDSDYEQVILALQDVVRGGVPISPIIARSLINRFVQKKQGELESPFHLTHKEETVLQYFAKGFNRKEIANILEVSVNTVNSHTRNIYKKLAVSTQTEAVYKASSLGIVSID